MFDLLELQQLMIHETSPEYRKQLAVVDTYMTRLGKGFSAAFLDDFWSELCKLSSIKSDEQFSSGLYLGSQLILALSQPPARIPRP